ncbi:immunoglobulin-like domain-containing protein, partial [Aliarcobacter cryaerophilus]|uniref:immunoglobulin-like domain-containing protein n=1 Tax=Aliarcobacter cryaerophilus TaxID=28198 RepID=UPI000AFE5485
ITLTGSDVNEGGQITITATVGKPVTESDLVITLDNGKTITIPVGESTGKVEYDSRADDVYVQGTDSTTVKISGTSGGNYEALDTTDTTTVTVRDDIDPIDVTITATVTTPKIIDVNTKTDGTTGVKVTGINSDGKIVDLSVIKGTNHDGFGVEGKNLSNGDTKELGFGEKIVVEFTDGKDVNSLDVSFAWRNNHETAKLTFVKGGQVVGFATVDGDGSSTTKAIVKYYDKNNNLIKEVNAKGSSDKVDEAFTFELPDLNGGIVSFDKVEFSAPLNKDDYLINKIVYKEVIDPTVTNIETDGGNVTFNIQIDEKYPPQGKATATVEVNGKTYQVELNATGRGTLTIDSSKLGDLSKVEAKVIKVDGGNYEGVKSTQANFDFTPEVDKPTSSNDSISTNEDVAYTLKVTDFGEVSGNTTEFKITELPTNGKLFLTVIKGETIFNKDGSQTVATEDSKVEVSKGQVISLAQVGAGKVEFVPNKDTDEDGSFKFIVGDGNGKFSEEYKTEIDVKAVADKPEASVGIKEIIVSTTNEVKNLGINLNASQSNGNGGNKTSSHKIDLGESISSVNINVSKVENGVVRFYDNNGNQVGQTVSIGSINGSYAPGNGLEFSSFEVVNLGGQGKGTAAFKFDGYSYTSTASDKVTYEIEYSAKLTDTDGSEKLSDFIIKNLPEGSKLFGADKQEVLANSDGTYTLKVDENGKAKLTLESQDKLSEDELNSIKASATSNEVNENGEVTDSATTTASSKLGQDIDLTGLKNILEGQKTGDIDLSKNGSQDKLTLTLDDVLKLSGDDNKIKISGDMFDSVALKNENGNDWTKSQSTITEDNKTFDVYTNSGDSTVQVKVEQPISDGITN